jgi:branched-chain amino acid aminotransferase
MLDKNTIVWFDGEFRKLGDTNVSILTHSLHYGSSIFEGIRAYETKDGPAIFRLKEHIERLFYSAKSLFMDLNYSVEDLMNACSEIVKKNNLKSAYIRPIVFYGDESMGLNPTNNKVHIAIIAWEWGKYLHENVKVMISSFKRISENTTIVDAKIGGHYINSIFATIEAKQKGFDEALLLDHDNFIAEGPGENIFFIKGNEVYTPSTGKILKGITRNSVMTILENLDYNIYERKIKPEEIKNFESAFFTGTAAEITPISSINDTKFDISKVEPIQQKFFKIVKGEDKNYNDWLYLCK